MLFHAPNRIAILRAAMKLLASAGHEATTIAEIVREAGVTLDTFYRYFESKDKLVRVLYEDLLLERDAFVAEPPPDDASLRCEVCDRISRGNAVSGTLRGAIPQ